MQLVWECLPWGKGQDFWRPCWITAGSLSVKWFESILYSMNQLHKNIVAIFVELILDVGITYFDFENILVMEIKFWFPFVVLDSDPKILMATNTRVVQMGGAEPSACTLLQIYSGHMSDTRPEINTLHLPYAADLNSVASCGTFVSPRGVRSVWDSKVSIRCGHEIWRIQPFEWCHLLILSLSKSC